LTIFAVLAGEEKILGLFSPAQFDEKHAAFFGENYHPALVVLRFARVERYGAGEQVSCEQRMGPVPFFGFPSSSLLRKP